MKTLELEFDIQDSVKIKELGQKGRIVSIWLTSVGLQYEVKYFHEAKLLKEYFFVDELEKI